MSKKLIFTPKLELGEVIRRSLVEKARFREKGGDELDQLVEEARLGPGESILDAPFAQALLLVVQDLIDEPRLLYAAIMAAEQFVRQVGTVQIGRETAHVVGELLWSEESNLAQFRECEDKSYAQVHAGLIQVAHAARVPIGADAMMREVSLHRFCRPLWLDLYRTEVPPNVALREYKASIRDGTYSVEALASQYHALKDEQGSNFVGEVFHTLQNFLLKNDPEGAQQLNEIANLMRFEPYADTNQKYAQNLKETPGLQLLMNALNDNKPGSARKSATAANTG